MGAKTLGDLRKLVRESRCPFRKFEQETWDDAKLRRVKKSVIQFNKSTNGGRWRTMQFASTPFFESKEQRDIVLKQMLDNNPPDIPWAAKEPV